MTGEILLRYLKILTNFRNGAKMVRTLRGGPFCPKAILWNGRTISHPERPGLVEAVAEIWADKAYTREVILKAGDVVLDIGANVGVFAVLAAQKGCRVLAFEPFVENFLHLHRNVEGLTVNAYQMAVGGRSGYGEMQSVGERSLDHTLDTSIMGSTPIITLEQVLEMAKTPRVALLKMDIEGAEADVFATVATEILNRIDRMVIEYHDNVRPGTLALIQSKLKGTHSVQVEPTPYDCGLLFARRRVDG